MNAPCLIVDPITVTPKHLGVKEKRKIIHLFTFWFHQQGIAHCILFNDNIMTLNDDSDIDVEIWQSDMDL